LFYGFIPLSGVKLVLVKCSLYMLSFCQVLGKSIELALLAQMGRKALAMLILICETLAYMLYKRIRGDFRYWLPLPKGWSTLLSVIARVIEQIIVDFTGA